MVHKKWVLNRKKIRPDCGFTLLEIIVALSIFILISTITIPVGLRIIAWQQLSDSTDLLVNRLRLAQSESLETGSSRIIEFAPYQPMYSLRSVSQYEGDYQFSPGVTYKDGYLQLNTNRVAYGIDGSCEVSGVIRLVSGKDEQDINLYLGGLCDRAGVLPWGVLP